MDDYNEPRAKRRVAKAVLNVGCHNRPNESRAGGQSQPVSSRHQRSLNFSSRAAAPKFPFHRPAAKLPTPPASLAESGSPAAQAPVADASRLSTPLLSLIPQPAQTLAAREAAVGRRLEGRRDHPTALPERPGLPQVPAWGEEEDVREARVAAAEGDRLL